jgi:hypothetical protein
MSNKLNGIKDYFFTREGDFVVSITTIVGTFFGFLGILLGIIFFYMSDDKAVAPAEVVQTISVQTTTGKNSPAINDTTIKGDFVIGDK